MKNTLILFLLGISLQFGFAQETRLDSSYVFDWVDEAWVNTRYFTYAWDNAQDYIRSQYRPNDNGEFYLVTRSEFLHDDQGNIVSLVQQDYDTSQNIWLDDYRATFNYNSMNQQVEFESFFWDEDLQIWEKFVKSESFYVTEHDELDHIIRYEDDDNNEWEYDFTLFNEYFFEGDRLDSLRSFRHRANEMDTLPFERKEYDYNSDGMLSQFRNHRVNLQDTNLYLIAVDDYLYNEKGLLENRKVALGNNWQAPEPRNDHYFTYDEDDKMTSECSLEIIDDVFVNNRKVVYVYAPFTISSTEETSLELSTSWNNNSLGRLELSVDNTDSSDDLRMFIVNVNGQILKSVKINKNQSFSTGYTLPSGMYAWLIEDASGRFKTEKLIVH